MKENPLIFHPHSMSRDLQSAPPLANEFCLLRGVDRHVCTGLNYYIFLVSWNIYSTI